MPPTRSAGGSPAGEPQDQRPARPSAHMTVEMSSSTLSRLEALRDATSAPSLVDVVRDALNVYEAHVQGVVPARNRKT